MRAGRPYLQNESNRNKYAINDNVLSSVLCSRAFRLPNRDSRTQRSNAQTDDESADGELDQAEGSTFKHFANQRQYRSEQHGLASSQNISDGCACERTEQSSESACSNDGALQAR